jgi:hypothetical protein
MKCKYCNTEFDKKTRICPSCNKKQPLNKILVTIIALMIISVIFHFFVKDDESTSTTSNRSSITEKPTATPKPKLSAKQSFIKSMTSKSGLKEKTVDDLYSLISTEIGFKIIKFKGKSKTGDMIYDIIADDYKLMVIIDDEKLYSIKCGDYNLYDKGKIKYTKKDILDRDLSDASAYYEFAKEIVKENLKSPKSAKFPSYVLSSDKINMQRNGDYVAVQSYVDAENSFGASIRSNFVVEFKILSIKDYTYQTVYININGTKSGEFKKLN